MKDKHLKYIIGNKPTLAKTNGDKLLFDSITKSIAEITLDDVNSLYDTIEEFALGHIDESTFDETDGDEDIFEQYDILHFEGNPITKELWRDRVIPKMRDRALDFSSKFGLTFSDFEKINLDDLTITLNKSAPYFSSDNDSNIEIKGDGCIKIEHFLGYIGLPDACAIEPDIYFAPKVVEDVLNILLRIDFINLSDQYIHIPTFIIDEVSAKSSYRDYTDGGGFVVTVEVGDKFKSVYNYIGSHIGIEFLENYIDDLINKKLKKYSSKPKKCPICDSKKIVKILYGEPNEEIVKMADAKEIALGGCFIRLNNSSWQCVECKTEFSKKQK